MRSPSCLSASLTLNARTGMQQKQIADKDAEIGELKAILKALAERVNALETGQGK